MVYSVWCLVFGVWCFEIGVLRSTLVISKNIFAGGTYGRICGKRWTANDDYFKPA